MPSIAKPTLAARVEDKFICIIPCKKEENEVKSRLEVSLNKYFIMAQKENIVFEKSKNFAIRIIRLCKLLQDRKEYIISKQMTRSGTSIGANISESQFAISKKDFQSKMYIALKETHETLYWLELLYKTEYLSETEYNSINEDCLELKKLLSSITKTTKEKLITEKQNTNLKNKKE